MPFISRPNITFCSAVSQGRSSANWNTMPRSCPHPVTSRPSTVTFPPEAVSSPMAMRSAVVLPQPDGPMSETISPSCTLKLTRESACTVCTAPSTRSVNCFDMSCRVTSPMPHSTWRRQWDRLPPRQPAFYLPLASFADARQRFLADVGVDQPADVTGLGELAERDHLVLNPDEVLDRDRELRIDHARLQSLLVDEGEARVVGFGAGCLARERDGLVAMGDGVAEGPDLRRHEPHGVLAALLERTAGHERAEAQEFGQHLARLDQHAHVLHRRQRHVFVGHNRRVDHPAEQRGETIAVATDRRELDLVG